ncbi:hypothetical protein [Georgfuchsia toluolica]|uniref:hypothetical protein n=1 Tax=Georgfuchsia toluolica TaxID=424218 RepID=UPI001C72AF48|nr:hypothetical protein [Georgfuchsia toluolica]
MDGVQPAVGDVDKARNTAAPTERKSMGWVDSVLPVFMAASGQKPGRLPELASTVQIDPLIAQKIRVNHDFQKFAPSLPGQQWPHSQTKIGSLLLAILKLA